jgi:DNA polymerase delta subunit 1
MYLVRYIEQARVCRVTLSDLILRGQQIKVLSQLLPLAREFDFVLPLKRLLTEYAPEGQYEGAIVLEPDIGFHEKPIACLDFSSLYPSEDISENLDYTTLVKAKAAQQMDAKDVFRSPAGHYFVRAHVRKGLLCILLDRLLAARKVAKADVKRARADATRLEAAGDVVGAEKKRYEADVHDARQTAIKLSANSGYGFTGVKLTEGGLMPCFEVSESITACGRRDLMAIVDWLKVHYPAAIVRYGDTDSVMVEPGMDSVREVMAWMHRVAAEINADLFANRRPMELAPEKVMCPTLFQAKKQYVQRMVHHRRRAFCLL